MGIKVQGVPCSYPFPIQEKMREVITQVHERWADRLPYQVPKGQQGPWAESKAAISWSSRGPGAHRYITVESITSL
ncbi:MAG: hypothetical protein BWY17_04740 [Deltaproteobacteria bacterium ADurb.Bin207]|jgi:hypothetical protein|nr:MAG: hypothetical protein BWY17_04740 [Deltaproteobacteria bacterium ADurb.Bin207]